MEFHEEKRTCLCCSHIIKGRSDKKFCDDNCRNAYNNQLKAKTNYSSFIRNINNTLLKNRKILEELLPFQEDMSKTTQDKLLQKGFVFKYQTHSYTNKRGNIYHFCYDYGWLPLENNWYLIVKGKESSDY